MIRAMLLLKRYKKVIALLFVVFVFLSFVYYTGALSVINEERDETYTWMGPIPPPGVFDNLEKTTSRELALYGYAGSGMFVIQDVPSYLWHHGCSPTAFSMVLGFYDTHYDMEFLNGIASYQPSINDSIASPEHYVDYSLPIDTPDEILPDLSELPTGDEHPDNCVADFLFTSQSVFDLFYGGTYVSDFDSGIEAYSDYVGYNDVTSDTVYWSSGDLSFQLFKSKINNLRPFELVVDSDGDGEEDHSVAVVGWNEDETPPEIGIYTTWSHNVAWIDVHGVQQGDPWGIHSATFVNVPLSTNQPPNPPSNPTPQDNAVNVPYGLVSLQWDCTDPDGQQLHYDVYFGTTAQPPRIVTGTYQDSWSVVTQPETIYHWQIVAFDPYGASTIGSIWSFTTGTYIPPNQPPAVPSNPSPSNYQTNVQVGIVLLDWVCSDPDGDVLSYDVYFGTTTNPEYHSTVSNSQCLVTAGQSSSTYYWRIYAWDGELGTTGPIWQFTTEDPPQNQNPVAIFTATVNGNVVSVDASNSYDPDGQVLWYYWDWENDGVYDTTGVTAQHYYEPGTYTIKLRVVDNEGASGTTTKMIVIEAPPPPPPPPLLVSIYFRVKAAGFSNFYLYGVIVSLTGEESYTSATDVNGYAFFGVKEGVYDVAISHYGYQTYTINGFTVDEDDEGAVYEITLIPTHSTPGFELVLAIFTIGFVFFIKRKL